MTSPRASAAPAFIWLARPRGAEITRSAVRASSRVLSLDPPSTTITSWPRLRSGASSASAAAMPSASFSAGTMIEIPGAPERLALDVVECPVIVQIPDCDLLLGDQAPLPGIVREQCGVTGKVFGKRGDRRRTAPDSLVAARPVGQVPIEYSRHLERALCGVVAVARAVREETLRLLFQLPIEPLGHIGFFPQH